MLKNISFLLIANNQRRTFWPSSISKVFDGIRCFSAEATKDEGPIPVDPQLQDLFTRQVVGGTHFLYIAAV
jgi:hypothetical protein